MAEPVLSREEKVAKVLKLHADLKDVKKMKKAMNEDYKDQIAGITDELDAIVADLRGDK